MDCLGSVTDSQPHILVWLHSENKRRKYIFLGGRVAGRPVCFFPAPQFNSLSWVSYIWGMGGLLLRMAFLGFISCIDFWWFYYCSYIFEVMYHAEVDKLYINFQINNKCLTKWVQTKCRIQESGFNHLIDWLMPDESLWGQSMPRKKRHHILPSCKNWWWKDSKYDLWKHLHVGTSSTLLHLFWKALICCDQFWRSWKHLWTCCTSLVLGKNSKWKNVDVLMTAVYKLLPSI